MSEFSEKLRLKERAEEDIYFAKRDKELIRALHEQQAADDIVDHPDSEQSRTGKSQKDTPAVTSKRSFHTGIVLSYLRKLFGRQ